MLIGEIQRLRREMELAADRSEIQKEDLQQKLTTTEKEYQEALQQTRHAHQEDITRLTDLKARCIDSLDLRLRPEKQTYLTFL